MDFFKTLTAAVLMAISISASGFGKDYEPTTTWPYIYEDFKEGVVTNFRGIEITHKQMNISLIQGKAHYLQNDRLMEVDMRTVAKISIGADEYMTVSGKLVRILRKTEHGTTALLTTIDMEAMNRPETGYGGGSSISSAWEVSTRTLSETSSVESRNISEISKSGGEPLILKKTRGIVYNRMFISASKSAILNIAGIDKAAVKKFMKDNSIRLSDDDDLSLLAEYIGTL